MLEVIRFQPLYQDRVWGGRWLESHFGRPLPADRRIGESWEIVDRPEAQSVIRGGKLEGMSIRDALIGHGDAIMGPKWDRSRPFPILVKWLDCRERLSLQVHPPASVAPALGGEPKTENWYVAAAEPGAALLVGLKPGIDRERFAAALEKGTVEDCVQRFDVSAGTSAFVTSGTVHAIDAGNLILEVQQNSDTTYRVYDWGRVGLDGKPRKLHVRESLASIQWDARPVRPVLPGRDEAVLADAPEFRLRRVPLDPGAEIAFSAGEQPRLVGVVSGKMSVNGLDADPLVAGDNVLLPFTGEFTLSAREPAMILVTENFV